MSSGHADLLDGIYGKRGEGLRAQETVALGTYRATRRRIYWGEFEGNKKQR